MQYDNTKQNEPVYECLECGLHYKSEEIVKQSRKWCAEYKSCNMSITNHSLEATKQQG